MVPGAWVRSVPLPTTAPAPGIGALPPDPLLFMAQYPAHASIARAQKPIAAKRMTLFADEPAFTTAALGPTGTGTVWASAGCSVPAPQDGHNAAVGLLAAPQL